MDCCDNKNIINNKSEFVCENCGVYIWISIYS